MSADLAAVSLSGTRSGPVVPVRALTRMVVPPMRIATHRSGCGVPVVWAGGSGLGLARHARQHRRARAGGGGAMERRSHRSEAAGRRSGRGSGRCRARCLRSGAQLRIAAQLVDPTSGTLIGATTVKGSMDDIFALEDALTNAAMALLSPHLTLGQHRPDAARCAATCRPTPRAFELFLRGMEEARHADTVPGRRATLFQQAVDEDPRFRTRLGGARPLRIVSGASSSTDRDAERSPRGSRRSSGRSSCRPTCRWRIATSPTSNRNMAAPPSAIVRLLKHAGTNRHDAQLFAGLVHACRYAGLFDASVAAHDEAVRLDPNVATSVEYTLAHLALSSRQRSDLRRHATRGRRMPTSCWRRSVTTIRRGRR